MTERKTHVNVGTIGHVDHRGRRSKMLLSAAIATAIASTYQATTVICSDHVIKEMYPKPRINKKKRHKVK